MKRQVFLHAAVTTAAPWLVSGPSLSVWTAQFIKMTLGWRTAGVSAIGSLMHSVRVNCGSTALMAKLCVPRWADPVAEKFIKIDYRNVNSKNQVEFREQIEAWYTPLDEFIEQLRKTVADQQIQDATITEDCDWEKLILHGWVEPDPVMRRKIEARRTKEKANAVKARERAAAAKLKKAEKERAEYERLKAKYDG